MMCFLQLKPGTIGKDLEGFHSRLDKSAPGAAEVLAPSCLSVMMMIMVMIMRRTKVMTTTYDICS